MAWWGKLLGGAFGYMLGGPLGAFLGAALGHSFDKGVSNVERLEPGERERVQTAFFTATFSVLGHLSKADGQVTPQEIGLAETLMDEMALTPEMRRTAIRLFDEGKAADFPLDEVLAQFRRECHGRHTLIRMFLEIQLQAAHADGVTHPAERQLLLRIFHGLGFSEADYHQLERMVRAQREFFGTGTGGRRRPPPTTRTGPSPEDAYAILGVSGDATDAEVKKAYRRLMSQHHPDKLVSKGLPEEMIKLATQKTREIRQAYETVRQARGMGK